MSTPELIASAAVAGAPLLLVAAAGPCLAPGGEGGRAHRMVPSALLSLGIVALIVFFLSVASPVAGRLSACCAVLGAAAVVGRWAAVRGGRITAAFHPLLGPVLLIAGIALSTCGLLALWHLPGTWFDVARSRFSHPLPSDNEIPAMMARRLATGAGLHGNLVGDWLSSDRPPLQAGLLLLVRSTVGWTGVPAPVLDFATGVLAQLTWLPACYALLRSLGAGRRSSMLALIFTASSGTVLVNTVFTWPKLLSAAFVLAALAVLLRRGTSPVGSGTMVTASTLTVLGILSHGAAVFAAPVLLLAVVRLRRRTSVRCIGLAGIAAGTVYLPWMAFQRWYAPPGDRLLKWHLAGVTRRVDTPLGQLLVHAYERPLTTLVHNKLANLAYLVSSPPWAGLGTALAGSPADRRSAEFFVLTSALGIAWIPLVLLLLAPVRRLRGSGAPLDPLQRRAARLLGAVLGSLLFWCLVMYGPGTTFIHQGSHVPVLLLLTVPLAWAAERRPRPAAGLVVLQLALTGLTYGPGSTWQSAHGLSPSALCALVLGGLVTAAALCPRPHGRTTAADPTHRCAAPRARRAEDGDTRPLPPLDRRSRPEAPCPHLSHPATCSPQPFGLTQPVP